MPVNNLELVGGLPLVSVIGTPRTMGESLGERLKPRLQMLATYLAERIATLARIGSDREPLTVAQVHQAVHAAAARGAALEPAHAMELEAMAEGSDLEIDELLVIHAYSDLLSYFACDRAAAASTYVGLPSNQTENHQPWMTLVLDLDPALVPYLMLVHRIPVHGPANISLTLAGLHPFIGLSEAGIAVAANELRVADGTPGIATSQNIASLLSAPGYEDALSRAQSGPRFGGCALHGIESDGRRFTVELSGRRQAVLADAANAPRVHTNHALDAMVAGAVSTESSSRERLERVAAHAVCALAVRPADVASWFGPGSGRHTSHGQRAELIRDPEATVLVAVDPKSRELHASRGLSPIERLKV